jgi:hypothetical protein
MSPEILWIRRFLTATRPFELYCSRTSGGVK